MEQMSPFSHLTGIKPVSPETLAKDRAELEEIFGKSFFPNVFETVKKRTAERMAEVSKVAKEFKAELKNAPEIILISDINDILKYDTQAKTIDDVYRRMTVKGWYSPGNGKIYVNLASHLTPEDVKATILHEAVGHSGLRRLLGKDAFDRLCNTVYQSLPEDKQKKMLEATRKIHPNATDEQLRLIIGDEYMAELAEGGAEQSIPQRIISAIREFLRSVGIDLEINEADLRYLLHASYKNIKDADAVTVVNNSALLARLRKAAEETHIKSEAESLFRLGDNNKTFSERVNRAVENKGTVMPNLNGVILNVVDVPMHEYKGSVSEAKKQAKSDARKKYCGKILHYNNYGTSFNYTIGSRSIDKSMSKSASEKSTNLGAHIAVLNSLDKIIANSIETEEHPDYNKSESGERNAENRHNPKTLIHRFFGAINIDG